MAHPCCLRRLELVIQSVRDIHFRCILSELCTCSEGRTTYCSCPVPDFVTCLLGAVSSNRCPRGTAVWDITTASYRTDIHAPERRRQAGRASMTGNDACIPLPSVAHTFITMTLLCNDAISLSAKRSNAEDIAHTGFATSAPVTISLPPLVGIVNFHLAGVGHRRWSLIPGQSGRGISSSQVSSVLDLTTMIGVSETV